MGGWCPRRGAGKELRSRCPGLSLPSPRTQHRRHQCRVRPSLGALPLPRQEVEGSRKGGGATPPPPAPPRQEGQNATDSTRMRDGEGPRRWALESRAPTGRVQPPVGEMLGEPPAPFQSRDKG